MHIVSDDAVLHISPNDLTSLTLSNRWNGTFVLISMRLDQSYQFAYDQMMQEFRVQARTEVTKRQNEEIEKRHYLHVYNFFGKYAEDKSAAITYRNRHLLINLSLRLLRCLGNQGRFSDPCSAGH